MKKKKKNIENLANGSWASQKKELLLTIIVEVTSH